jgi:phage putative head morphogenesis protein, SPP1 gp7 family
MAKKKIKQGDYWSRREEQIDTRIWEMVEDELKVLHNVYDLTLEEIKGKINDFYFKFSRDNKISLADAKRILTSDERKAYMLSLDEYIRKGKTLNYSQAYAKQLEDASTVYRVSRLESLQTQINQKVAEFTSTYQNTANKVTMSALSEAYNRNAFTQELVTGARFDIIDAKTVEAINKASWTWDGETFSDRIWTKQEELVNFLNVELKKTLIAGEHPKKLVAKLVKKFDSNKKDTKRLIETEASFFVSAGKKEFYEKTKTERYVIDAVLDTKTSDVCMGQHGENYAIEDWEIGVTAPPFHPHCRTTTSPYFKDLDKLIFEPDDDEEMYQEYLKKRASTRKQL